MKYMNEVTKNSIKTPAPKKQLSLPTYITTATAKEMTVNKVINFVKEDKFRNEDVSYSVGDHVRHDEFGEGVVISLDGSLITIAFPHPYGIKKMMAKHKSLTKVEQLCYDY